MGTHDGASTGSVIQQLLDYPQGFNLFQAISLLEAEVARAGRRVTGDHMRLRAHVSLAFEPSDIRDVTAPNDKDSVFTVWTPVLSLAGANGPLPAAFTEMLLARSAKRDHGMAEFLDIFNQRFLYLLYVSRRKHHAALGDRPLQSAAASVLSAVGSLRQGQQGALRTPLRLRHAGLLGGAPRSMTGLLALLRDCLGLRIQGRQFVGQWLTVGAEATGRLNGLQALNGTVVLGRRVWDQAAGIALEIAVDSMEQLRSGLPGGAVHTQLKELVGAYVRQELSVTLVLQPSGALQSPPARLAVSSAMRLGWTSWLPSLQPSPLAPVCLKLPLCDS